MLWELSENLKFNKHESSSETFWCKSIKWFLYGKQLYTKLINLMFKYGKMHFASLSSCGNQFS